eukprot:scaffold7271_cov88-Cylindrotheca_fusiformis.AAC.2
MAAIHNRSSATANVLTNLAIGRVSFGLLFGRLAGLAQGEPGMLCTPSSRAASDVIFAGS